MADSSVTVKDAQIEMDIQLPPDAPASSAPTALDVYAVEKSGTSHKIEMLRAESVKPGIDRRVQTARAFALANIGEQLESPGQR